MCFRTSRIRLVAACVPTAPPRACQARFYNKNTRDTREIHERYTRDTRRITLFLPIRRIVVHNTIVCAARTTICRLCGSAFLYFCVSLAPRRRCVGHLRLSFVLFYSIFLPLCGIGILWHRYPLLLFFFHLFLLIFQISCTFAANIKIL